MKYNKFGECAIQAYEKMRFEVLEYENQQYKIFFGSLTDKESLGKLSAEYIQNATVSSGG